jgi:hypothetical protein
MVVQVLRVDRNRLVVLFFFVFRAPAAGLEAVQEDLLPVDLVLVLLGFLRLLLRRRLFFRDRGLLEVEERIVEKLLLDVLLQVEQGHVEKIHRLVQAWIDLHLLLQLCSLVQPCLYAHTAISGRR